MPANQVICYLKSAVRVYHAALSSVGLLDAQWDLLTLSTATRKHLVKRGGELTVLEGHLYKYLIHGAGYSFTDQENGLEIHFDVYSQDGMQFVQFGAWKLSRYLTTLGTNTSLEEAISVLDAASRVLPALVHVAQGQVDYYLYPANMLPVDD